MAEYDNLYDLVHSINQEAVKSYSAQDIQKNKILVQTLRAEIQDNLREYYRTYDPMSYNRTYDLLHSMTYIKFNEADGIFTIEFNERAFNPDFNGNDNFIPVVVNYGWDWKGPRPHLPRSYQYYSGSGYITKAIEDFNKKYAKKGISAQFIINGIPAEDWGSIPYR